MLCWHIFRPVELPATGLPRYISLSQCCLSVLQGSWVDVGVLCVMGESGQRRCVMSESGQRRCVMGESGQCRLFLQVMSGCPQNETIDFWSLGVVIFRFLSGRVWIYLLILHLVCCTVFLH